MLGKPLVAFVVISILDSQNRSPEALKQSFIITVMQLYRPCPHNKGGVSRGLVCV